MNYTIKLICCLIQSIKKNSNPLKKRKIIVIAFLVVFVIASAVISFAQDSNKADKPMMGKGMMMRKGMMGRGMMNMCPMHSMMMGGEKDYTKETTKATTP